MKWSSGVTNGQIVGGGNGAGNRTNQLNEPTDVYLDRGTNSIIICDWGNNRVMQWSLQNGTTSGQIILTNISCYGLTMDDQGFLYVTDLLNENVMRYTLGGTNGTLIGGGNTQVRNSTSPLSYPSNVFVDKSYSVYLSDTNNSRVIKWEKNTAIGTVVAGGQGRGTSVSQLNFPFGVYADQLGTVYVSDSYNNRVVRWLQGASQGTIIIEIPISAPSINQLSTPRGLSFDQYGNCYLADWGNDRVLRFDIIKT